MKDKDLCIYQKITMMKQSIIFIYFMALSLVVNAQNQTNMTINQEAPVFQSKAITIDAQPEKVWEVLTEIDKWPSWNSKITKSTINDQPSVGVSFTWKTNGSKIKSQIHTFDPEKTMGWKGKAFGVKAVHNWYLKPVNNGTRVMVEESMEGWIIALMKKKMNSILEKDMIYWLEQLKIESEN
jgi:uncharacterized protein YndB with AHSA1/START domain